MHYKTTQNVGPYFEEKYLGPKAYTLSGIVVWLRAAHVWICRPKSAMVAFVKILSKFRDGFKLTSCLAHMHSQRWVR